MFVQLFLSLSLWLAIAGSAGITFHTQSSTYQYWFVFIFPRSGSQHVYECWIRHVIGQFIVALIHCHIDYCILFNNSDFSKNNLIGYLSVLICFYFFQEAITACVWMLNQTCDGSVSCGTDSLPYRLLYSF